VALKSRRGPGGVGLRKASRALWRRLCWNHIEKLEPVELDIGDVLPLRPTGQAHEAARKFRVVDFVEQDIIAIEAQRAALVFDRQQIGAARGGEEGSQRPRLDNGRLRAHLL